MAKCEVELFRYPFDSNGIQIISNQRQPLSERNFSKTFRSISIGSSSLSNKVPLDDIMKNVEFTFEAARSPLFLEIPHWKSLEVTPDLLSNFQHRKVLLTFEEEENFIFIFSCQLNVHKATNEQWIMLK